MFGFSSKMALLEASGIFKAYGQLEVLKGIDLKVEKGQVVSVVGASGAGKSTLLHILGTLDASDAGVLKIQDKDTGRLSANQLARFRNQEIGFVFQFHNLLPEFTALENVMMPAFLADPESRYTQAEALHLLAQLSLGSTTVHQPSALTGQYHNRLTARR